MLSLERLEELQLEHLADDLPIEIVYAAVLHVYENQHPRRCSLADSSCYCSWELQQHRRQQQGQDVTSKPDLRPIRRWSSHTD